jgi:DGQHR domain-containing protein
VNPLDAPLFGPGESVEGPLGQETVRYSVSLVRQGEHQFYTLTMHISILAETCFVSRRIEDPKMGFQRRLDKFRARQIAEYIDTEKGVIPNAIILSAQPDAEFHSVGRGKTIEFKRTPKAFLILDGQHRVYGFTMAKTPLRVPVVIFNNLTLDQEARLFIDINTKQRPVPNELLLDIKKIAGSETELELKIGQVYDLFNSRADSPLLGKMAAFEKSSGKISRVTFNAAVRPLVPTFKKSSAEKIYEALSSYVAAFSRGCESVDAADAILNPQVFRAAMKLFTDAAPRVSDRYGKKYTTDAFAEMLEPVFPKVRNVLRQPTRNSTELYAIFSKQLKSAFEI